MTMLILKATVAMVLALALVAALRRARASLRHLVLASLFAFLLLLPVVQQFAPKVPIAVKETRVTKTVLWSGGLQPAEARGRRAEARRSTSVVDIYVAGVAILFAWLGVGLLRLRRLAAHGEVWLDGTAAMNAIAHAANIRRPALVILSSRIDVPLTFGFRRSTIVLPVAAKHWSEDALTRALRHELEHVRREDWLLQLVARAACALYWPHPLAWVAWRRFCVEAERACDDAVVTSSAPEAYAGQLVSLARELRRMTTVPALGMAGRSRLAQRVHAILDPLQKRGPHGRAAAVAAMVVVLALLVSLAPTRLVLAALPWNGGEALYAAAGNGNMEIVRQMLDGGADVNTVVYGDGTPLIAAVRAGDVEMIEFLLQRGADVNLAVRGDGNPLIAAAARGRVQIVQLLLNRGADVDAVVPGDENALINAARYGHVDVVRLLLKHGADPNIVVRDDGRIRTALRMARRGLYTDIEQMLLRAGVRE